MALINLDPLDIGSSIVGQIIKRMVLFFLAGFIGVIVGLFCTVITDWSDFLEPQNIEWGLGGWAPWIFFCWPFLIPFTYGLGFLLVFPAIGLGFLRVFFSELTPLFTLLLLAVLCTLGIVMEEDRPLSWVIFSFISIGYTALGCYLCKFYWPDKIEDALNFLKFGVGHRAYETMPTSQPKKVDPKTWGENVELDSEEWDDE